MLNATTISITTDNDGLEPLGSSKPSPSPSKYQSSMIDATMDRLFNSLKAIKPAWMQAWPTDADVESAKAMWKQAFRNAGITIKMVDNGLAKATLEKSDFIPSVGKFISWCEPDYGLPSEEDAWKEARYQASMQKPEYSHEAIRYAVNETDKFFIASQPENQTKPVFLREYRRVAKLIKDGFDPRLKKIAQQEPSPYALIVFDEIKRTGSANEFIAEMADQGVEIIINPSDDGKIRLSDISVVNHINGGRFKSISDIMEEINK